MGHMELIISYAALMLSYMRLMLRYTKILLGYRRPLLSYTRRVVPHVKVHRARATRRNPRDAHRPRVQTLSKHTYI